MNLLEALQGGILLGDGGMGTQLQAAGLKPGESGAMWNLIHPEKVLEVQKAYVAAGSDLLITNTFTASPLALASERLEGHMVDINRTAAEIARRAFSGNRGFVLGDLGPFGGMMEPYGTVSREDVFRSYRDQAEALLAGGVDALIIETQTSLEEMEAALEGALEAGAPCIIASMAYDLVKDGTDFRTMMGVSPEDAVELISSKGADVIGANCGTGIDIASAARIARRYREACSLPVMAQPNAGQPEMQGDHIIYRETPQQMAEGVRLLVDAGVSIVGSCCGTTPEHVALFRREIDNIV